MKLEITLTDEQAAQMKAALLNSMEPEAIPADKEPDHVESDHPECKDGCQYAFETGVWPNRVCPIGECQHCNRKPEPAKRREWYASVSHGGSFLGSLGEYQEPIQVREVLPGDPSPDQVAAMVDALRCAKANNPGWMITVSAALKPFTGKESE